MQQRWEEPTKAVRLFNLKQPSQVLLSHSSPKSKVQKLTFVSRLKTPFCLHLFRFDSSKNYIVENPSVHAKSTQTNADKNALCWGCFSNQKCLVETIAENKLLIPLILQSNCFQEALKQIREVQQLESNSVQTDRSKIVHAKRSSVHNEIAKWREAPLHISRNWKFKVTQTMQSHRRLTTWSSKADMYT